MTLSITNLSIMQLKHKGTQHYYNQHNHTKLKNILGDILKTVESWIHEVNV